MVLQWVGSSDETRNGRIIETKIVNSVEHQRVCRESTSCSTEKFGHQRVEK